MTFFYSKSTQGFYEDSVHSDIPADAIKLTDDQYDQLIGARAQGKALDVTDSGQIIALDPPSPTKDDLIAQYESAIQVQLDLVAKSWGYASIVAGISYMNSTNARYKADAEALNAWRDSVWAEAYTIEQGTLPESAEAFVAMLPAAPTKPIA